MSILRALPAGTPERNLFLSETLLALTRLEKAASNRAKAIELLLEARGLGVALLQDDQDYLATELASAERVDPVAMDVYLQTIAYWKGKQRPSAVRQIYDLLERLCVVSEDLPREELALRLRLCTRLIAADRDLAFPYYYRGIHAFITGNYTAAMEDLRRARDRRHPPAQLEFYLNVCSGYKLRDEGKLEHATAYFVEAAKQNPGSYSANFEAGASLVTLCQKRLEEGTTPGELDANRRRYAITLLQRACQLQDRAAEAYFMLGCACYMDRRADEAADALQKAVLLRPSAPYYYEYARALRRKRQTDAALEAAQEAVKLDPGLLKARQMIATIALRKQDFQRAKEEYHALVSALPPSDNTRMNAVYGLGTCCYEVGDYSGAIQWFTTLQQEAVDLTSEGLYMLARSYSRARDFGNGERRFAELIATEPSRGDYHYYLGCCQAHQKRFEEAIASFANAERCGDLKQNVSLQRGYAWESLQKYENAREEYRKAAVGPGGNAAQYRLGMLCLERGETEQALSHLALADPTPDVLATMGRLYAEQGNLEASDQAFLAAIEAARSSPVIARQYGSALLKRGEVSKAIPYLQEAERLGDSTPELHSLLGEAHFAAGDREQAMAQWEKHSDDPAIRENLRAVCLQAAQEARGSQDYARALDYWKRAIALGADASLLHEDIRTALIARAKAAALSGEPMESWEADLREVIETHGQDSDYVCVLAALDLLNNAPIACIERLETIHNDLSPELRDEASYLLGLAWLQQGDAQRAHAYLQTGADCSADQQTALKTSLPRAYALAQMGCWDDAAQILCSMVK